MEAGFKNRYGSTDVREIPSQDPNTLKVNPQPVPSNLPKPVEYTRQVQNTENRGSLGGGASSDKMALSQSQSITIDPASLGSLDNFNSNFASYVDKLVNHTFPPIQHKVEISVAPLQVQITGAAAFEQLSKEMNNIADSLVTTAIGEVKTQIRSFIPDFPSNAVSGQKSKGK